MQVTVHMLVVLARRSKSNNSQEETRFGFHNELNFVERNIRALLFKWFCGSKSNQVLLVYRESFSFSTVSLLQLLLFIYVSDILC